MVSYTVYRFPLNQLWKFRSLPLLALLSVVFGSPALYLGGRTSQEIYPAFFRTFVPMRNSFRTVPVGSRFIWSYSSVTASKNPAIASSRSRV